MLAYDAIVRRYAWFERRRMELVRLKSREYSNLYRLIVYGNPDGYYDRDAAAEDMRRKIENWELERNETVRMQHLLENIIWDLYGWIPAEEMLEDGEAILEGIEEMEEIL